MYGMLRGCSSLKELNLNNFNTNNVTDMRCMFGGCLDELKLKIKSQFKNFTGEAFLDLNIHQTTTKLSNKLFNLGDYIMY